MKFPSNFPFNVKRLPFFYGWMIVFTGTVGVLFSIPGQTMGVGPFTDHLINHLGISRDYLSNAYLIGTASSSLILTYAGRFWDKHGARVVLVLSSLILAGSLVIGSYSVQITNTISSVIKLPKVPTVFVFLAIFFFAIRFSGQGVLTLVSRNLIMKWFERKRGLANGISSAFVSLGFSLAPVILFNLITDYEWFGAWQAMALALVLFCVFVILFVRDSPEDCNLLPDGKEATQKSSKLDSTSIKEYNLKQAKRTWALWVYSLTISFYSMFVTGFTFHVEAIFKNVGLTSEKAFSSFLPTAIIAVVLATTLNIISDYIKLKYLLKAIIIGGLLSTFGIIYLALPVGFYLVIIGNGIMGAIFTILIAVTWPRFYGRKYLGEISGFAASIMVVNSAVGPSLFAYSLKISNSFSGAAIVSIGYLVLLLLVSFKAKNPQIKHHQ